MRQNGESCILFHLEVHLGRPKEAFYLNSLQRERFRALKPEDTRDSRQHVLLRKNG